METRTRWLHLVAITATLTATSLVWSMTLPLLGLALDGRGASGEAIGLSAAAQSLGGLVIAPAAALAMRTRGPALPTLLALVITAALYIAFPLFDGYAPWLAIRFALGLATGALWIIGEAWINQLAEEHARGRALAFYSMSLSAGSALGPTVLSVMGTTGWGPFLVSAGLTLASAIPVLFVLRGTRPMAGRPSSGFVGYLRQTPVPLLICGLSAAMSGIIMTFLPLYGLGLGLTEDRMLFLASCMGVGGIACQYPIGWLADRIDRMRLALAGSLALLACVILVPWTVGSSPWDAIHFFVLGGVMGGLYTVGMTLLGQRYRDADLAGASAAYGIMWGGGMLAGPPIGGTVMETVPPHGFVWALAALVVLYLPFPLLAVLRRRT